VSRRVAITGIGLVTALGTTREETWRRMVAGECGVRPATVFDASGFRSRVAAEVDMTAIDAGTFESDAVLKLAPGSVVVTNAGEGQTEGTITGLVDAGEFSKTVVKEPDNTPTFFVLRRLRAS